MKDDGGSAFPHKLEICEPEAGMSLRDYFAAAALQNSAICTGTEPDWQLSIWFNARTGITRQEIVAKQAASYANAMLAERSKS